ncbi:hypothetical protein G6F23_008666 [Rhizopus arrhizus]|nr:hypothetical protein G6F23_008666 [Rhizopus arrhizus]KAG0756260.1 hypothetical protein G6F24_011273 [Rhizopus arrhizus]
MSVEERTRLYQEKYDNIIVAENVMRSWIKTNKEKGPPLELSEAYRPPPRARLASVSIPCTQSKRRSLLVHLNRECDPMSPSPKASFSTFLKKAIRPSESSSNRQKPTPRPSVTCSASKSIGFSLGSSFNRLSSSKQPHSATADRRISTVQGKASDTTSFQEKPCLNQKDHVRKKETQQRLLSITECPKPNGHSTLPTKKSIRPHSTIVPYSPSSIFLDRLQLSGIYEENGHQTVQSNTSSKNKTHHAMNRHGCTRPGSLIQTYDLTESAETRSIDNTSSLQNSHDEKRTASAVKNTDSRSRRGSTLQTLAERHQLTLIHTAKEAKQKKRMSFSLGPSLSSIRFIPQKVPTLKRQSMLA